MSSAVNLTYGLRWDYNSVPHSRDRNNGDLVELLGNYATSDVTVRSPGSRLWNQRYDNLAPRIGAAWVFRKQPGREAVLRAGGGLFYDTGIAEASSQPWVQRLSRRAGDSLAELASSGKYVHSLTARVES